MTQHTWRALPAHDAWYCEDEGCDLWVTGLDVAWFVAWEPTTPEDRQAVLDALAHPRGTELPFST